MSDTVKITLFIVFVFISAVLIAGPTIIRDDRIKDTAMTPTLGRGYTVATNTFQSKCLENIQITDPSYDFRYKFDSIDLSKSTDLTTEKTSDVTMGAPLSFLIPGSSLSVNLKVSSKNQNNKTEYYQHILVEIDMDTYYASVDEARSRLGSSASNMLQKKDIPGFFMSCGTYYVRSLGRHAKFTSVFSYSQEQKSRDEQFESALTVAIKSFSPVPSKCKDAEKCDDSVLTPSGSMSVGYKKFLKESSTSKKLTITTQAEGLGKNEGATLISYDLDTFRAAIKDAFISMQNPMTGKVTSMEIVPWVENTEFQNLIELEKEDVSKEDKKGGTAPVQQLLLYQKKHILNLNGEYLAEIERADRNMMNIYYQAQLCKQTIERNYAAPETTGDRKSDGGTPMPKQLDSLYADKKLRSNKQPNNLKRTITLKELYDKQLADPGALLQEEETFMYGSGGARECINKMLESGMFKKSWRDIDTCKNLRGKLSSTGSSVIDEYCMPTFQD